MTHLYLKLLACIQNNGFWIIEVGNNLTILLNELILNVFKNLLPYKSKVKIITEIWIRLAKKFILKLVHNIKSEILFYIDRIVFVWIRHFLQFLNKELVFF